MTDASINRTPPLTCAVCEAPLAADAVTESVLYPFCSKRCKLVDLGRWVDGEYRVEEPLRPEHLDDLPDEDLQRLLGRNPGSGGGLGPGGVDSGGGESDYWD